MSCDSVEPAEGDAFYSFLEQKTVTDLIQQQPNTQSEATDTVGTTETLCQKHKTLLYLKIHN